MGEELELKNKEDKTFFSVTSDETTGQQWANWLGDKFRWRHVFDGIDSYIEKVLLNKSFKPTLKTYKIKVIKGKELKGKPLIANVKKEAEERGFISPNTEATCLIARELSSRMLKTMSLDYVIIMHEPFKDGKTLKLLTVCNSPLDLLYHFCPLGDKPLKPRVGFIFVVPE